MKSDSRIPNGRKDQIIQIQIIHRTCTPLFKSILAKRIIMEEGEQKRIIDLFFQKIFCRMTSIQIKRIWKGGRGIPAIRIMFIDFIQECNIIKNRAIEGETSISICFNEPDTITHIFKINPEIEIRRYRNIISNEFHAEHYGLIFELKCNGFNAEEIAIKTGHPISTIDDIIQKIISYLRSVA